jgi:copper chaperone
MIAFDVNDMTCGHCAGAVTRAVEATDDAARVEIDLVRRQVRIEPGHADAQQLVDSIRQAGYAPVPVRSADVAAPVARQGCCCGGQR